MTRSGTTTPDRRSDPRRALEGLLGVPFTSGNRVELLRNGDETIPAVVDAIGAAQRSVEMLWFLWGRGEVTDRVADALAGRARAGVRVRVLLDAFGAHGIDDEQLRRMREAGCTVRFRRPLRTTRLTTLNLRSHRRVLVCDETLALTGGLGIDRAWAGRGDRPGDWRDTSVRVRGPAVEGIRAAFALPWIQGQLRRPGGLLGDADHFPEQPHAGDVDVQVLRPSSQPGWNEAALALLALFDGARRRVRICTPYARVPGWAVERLVHLVQRGVQVQLLVPGPHVDRRWVQWQGDADLDELLAGGIEVWRFQPSLLHAKVVTVDGRFGMLGTTNLDIRSLALNEQVALVVDDGRLVADLDRDYDQDLLHSEQISLEEWRARPRGRRALEQFAATIGRPLLGWGARGLTGDRP